MSRPDAHRRARWPVFGLLLAAVAAVIAAAMTFFRGPPTLHAFAANLGTAVVIGIAWVCLEAAGDWLFSRPLWGRMPSMGRVVLAAVAGFLALAVVHFALAAFQSWMAVA